MEKTQAFFISKRLADIKTAEEMVEVLSTEFGFDTSYLTLADKKPQLQEIRESIEEEQRRLSYNPEATQFWGKHGYSLEDLYMVRATDVFSIGHTMTTPKDGQVLSHMDFNYKAFEAAKKAVGLPEKYTPQEYTAKQPEIKKIEDSITPYLRQYRSTKHFTVNTLVSDNSGGSWANMPYIYIEPMQPHLEDKTLASIAPHDTFFRGDVTLTQPTLIIQQQHLAELLNQNNPQILETLLSAEIIILDDNCKEHGSPSEHVAYVLREMKGAPYYHCSDHGVNISSRQGVYQPLYQYAKEHDIAYGSDHYYSSEKKMDELHFLRNIAEDSYSYLAFIRGNPKFNLSEEQLAIIDNAIDAFHKTCEDATQRGIPLDFTEETTPCADYEYLKAQNGRSDYDRAYGVFCDLQGIIENAFTDSDFYATVDISVLAEETTRYNEEYKAAIEQGSEYARVEIFKPEIAPTPTEE
ncbi:MAG: hypothetical protein IJW32_04350 [Clostridia bacterium]|nr:hypothetical protein [Clostridia bacterium]